MRTPRFDESRVRVASPDDESAVSGLLRACYPVLMRPHYKQSVLAAALPEMTRANPTLLASGRFYLVESENAAVVGCGGWSRERPGSGDIEDELAHIRHFATHPGWLGLGIGRLIYGRCEGEARAAGNKRFQCYSSLSAEGFYSGLGFETVEQIHIQLSQNHRIPSVLMVRTI